MALGCAGAGLHWRWAALALASPAQHSTALATWPPPGKKLKYKQFVPVSDLRAPPGKKLKYKYNSFRSQICVDVIPLAGALGSAGAELRCALGCAEDPALGLRWRWAALALGCAAALGCAGLLRWACAGAGLRWRWAALADPALGCAGAGSALALGCAALGCAGCAGLRCAGCAEAALALRLRWRWAALALGCAEPS